MIREGADMANVDFTLEDILTATAKQTREIVNDVVRDAVQPMIDKAVDRLDQQIDRLDVKFERRFDVMEYRIDRVEGKIDDTRRFLEGHAQSVYEDYTALSGRVTRLETGSRD